MSKHPFLIASLVAVLLAAPRALSQAPDVKTKPAQPRASGDGLPPDAVARLGATRFRHAGAVLGVAFSPDGKRLASGDESGQVCLWDAATGRPVLELPKKAGPLVLFTPDGKNLVCAGEDKVPSLYGAATGKLVRSFGEADGGRTRGRGVNATHLVALSPDGKLLAEAHGPEVILWEVASGNELRRLKAGAGRVGAVAFSADGKTIAGGDDAQSTTIYFWDVKTGEQVKTIASAHNRWTTALAFSPDGKCFASASPYEVALWDAGTRKELARFKTGAPSLAFSPDGKLLAGPRYGGGDDKGTIYVYDVATKKELHTLHGHVTLVHCVAFSPDGKKIATGGAEGTVRLWDPTTGRDLTPDDGHQALINSVAFSPDGTLAATAAGGDHTIRIWGTASGAPLARLDIPCRHTSFWCATTHGLSLAFGPDGKTVACDDKVYDIKAGRLLRDLPGLALAYSADGKLVAGVSSDRNARRGTVSVWDRGTGREVAAWQPLGKETAYDTGITTAAFSLDGRLLAVGIEQRSGASRDQKKDTVYLFEAASGKLLHKYRPELRGPNALVFSPDGRLLATAGLWDEPVSLWRVADGGLHAQLRGEEQRLHWSEHRPIAFSPNGMLLAGGGVDNRVVVWEVLTGQPVHHLAGHEKPVRALAFAPDGRHLLSAGSDMQAILWDLAPEGGKATLAEKDVERLWGELGGDNPEAAYRAARSLAAAPDKALPWLKGRLKLLPAPDLARVPRLLADLDDNDFEVREAASKQLQALGPQVEDALRKTLAGKPSAEVRKRVERLLSEIHQSVLPREQMRQLRAIQLLEWVGTPEAVARLEPLARGAPGLRPTREAEAALRRLAARRAAPAARPAAAPRSRPAEAAPPRPLAALKKEITSLAFSADGLLAAASADGKVRIFDAAGKEVRTIAADDGAAFAVAFAPDGKVLATAGKDGKVRLWDPKGGEARAVLEGHAGAVTSLAFAPDGRLLASGSLDTTVRLWDPSTKRLVRKLDGGQARVLSVAFAPDGKTLAAGDSDECVNTVAGVPWTIYRPHAVRRWDVVSGRALEALPNEGHLVVFSPDGKYRATADLATVLLVGGEHGMRIAGKDNVIGPGQGEPSLKGSVAITVWDRATGQLRGRFAGKGAALAFSSDGRILATGRGSDVHLGGTALKSPGAVPVDGRLRLWEIDSGQEVLAFPEATRPTVLAFSPNRHTLAAGLKDGGVLLYDLAPASKEATPADFERAWAALAGDDAGAAYRALWQLRAAGGKAVPFLAKRLRPTPADEPALARILADLDAEQFAVREAAYRELERRGADAEPALCRALQRATSTAFRERIVQLLGAPGVVRHADAAGRERAVAALEAIGSAEARALLAELAQGSPLVAQTQAARAALGRLGQR